jgi:hypothetical protein
MIGVNRRAFTIALMLAAPGAAAVVAQSGSRSIPYDVDKRPMPTGADLEKLVPRTVGSFQRPPIPAGTKFPVNEDQFPY